MANSSVTLNIPTPAAQSDMETGTSVTLMVTPGRQRFHQSAAKAWALFNGSGTIAIRGTAYNISSLTDNGTGDYTANFTTSFSDANYTANGNAANISGANNSLCVNINSSGSSGVTAPTTSACRFTVTTSGVGVLDSTYVSILFFGDQ